MSFEAIMGIVRHVLTFGGGFLVASGSIAEGDLAAGVGAITTLIGIGWSIWQKRQAAA